MRWRSLFVSIVLAAFALALWRLDEESIWHDEGWSIRAIQSPFGTPDDNTPPLYYLTLHLLQQVGVGETPFALRYGSVFIHLLTVSLGFRIAYRWYGLTAAAITGSLLALSPLLWEYAQEIRAYVAVPLIALALLAGTQAFLRRTPPARTWIFLLAVELAGLYTHNLSVPLVVWVNVIVVGVLVWRSLSRRTPPQSVEGGQLMLWLLSQGILFLLYLPWLLSQSPSGTLLNTVPKFNFQLLKNIWQGYFFPVAASDLPDSFLLKLQILAVVTLAAGLILMWRERSLRTLLLISQAVLLPTFSTLLIIRASIDFHPRYYVLGIPALLLLLAAAIEHIPYKNAVGVILVGLVGLITQQSLSLIAENRRYQHDDFAAMADYYAALPADTLIIIPYDHEYTFEIYFRDKIDARLLTIPLHSPPEEAIQTINAAVNGQQKHVELLTWYQLPADERGMYACLLAAASEEVLDTYEVYGLSTTGFLLSQPMIMQPIQTEANFNSALRLTDVQYAASQQGVCFYSHWTLVNPPESPVYHAAARILNPFGWEMAAGDSLILRDDQARVEDWEVGDDGAAFTFLPLPDGVPDMDYDAVLRLYTPQNLSGWDVVNAEGAPLGKDLRLPKIRLQGQQILSDTPQLTRDNSREGSLFSGQRLRVEVVIPEAGQLVLQGDSWELRENINIGLNWIEFLIPVEAEGEAVLKQDTVLKTYTVAQIERLMTPPEFEIPINAQLGEIAILHGATVMVRGEHIQVDLVWQALTTPNVEYQVFVQLLDAEGRLVVQDMTMPDPRPTTTWIEGEYVQDSHNLQLNGLEYRRLIVGLYDPLTAQRVLLLDGADFVEIPIR